MQNTIPKREPVEQRDGGYWMAGTRISLDSVIYAYREGLSPQTIATECFPTLSLVQIEDGIAYYLSHREELDLYLAKGEREFERQAEASRAADPEFYAKLDRVRG